MIKVKLIHPNYLSAPNGANTVMNALLASKDQFLNENIELTSLSPDTFLPRSFSKEAQKSAKAVWKRRLRLWLKNATKYSRLACDLIIYLTEIAPSKKIIKGYIESNPCQDEVVFFHTLIPCYYFLKYSKQTQHVVMVLHTNGESFKMVRLYYPMLEQSLVYKKMLRMEKYVLEHVDKINFVAAMAKETFLKEHPEVNASKVSFVYNGIKDEFIAEGKTQSRRGVLGFCCVASISKRKGQHYIVEALKMFGDEKPKVHFTFVGEGVDAEALLNEVKEYGLDDYVTFAGVSQNVDKYLVNNDVFILPSEDEGLPMAIIEAMRASLPIVSTPVGGIPEMIDDGKNGVLIEPTAQGVYEMLRNVNSYDWQMMGTNARKTFEEKFTVEKMVDGYINLFKF